MEEGQYKFYRLRDELTHYIASTPPEKLDPAVLRGKFDKYRQADSANSVNIGRRRRLGCPMPP